MRQGRNDGAAYVCGYAVEVALKVRICKTIGWPDFPATASEFKGLQTFKTHDLDLLLRLSGKETDVRSAHAVDWSVVVQWDPESRYLPIGHTTPADARQMILSSRSLVKVLL